MNGVTTAESDISALNERPPIPSRVPTASSSSIDAPQHLTATQSTIQTDDGNTLSVSSTDLSLNASSSNYSIWPEDLVIPTANRLDPEAANFRQDEDIVSATNNISHMSLGDYHSARLAVHDRSDTSSPVSNSEEDEDDGCRSGIQSRRSASAVMHSKHGQSRPIWTSNSEEELDTAHDGEIAFKSGWNASDAADAVSQDVGDEGSREGEEPAANRVPNEIIMHVSPLNPLI
jgi:hypothetical protein